MEKDVLIRVKGLQVLVEEEEEDNPIEVIVAGQYYLKNGNHYFRYEEVVEDFPDEKTVNYVKIGKDGVEVRKSGLMNVHMVFEPDKKSNSYYTTPFGTLELGIYTMGITVEEEENKLKMQVEYALDMQGEYVADCSLSLEAVSRSAGKFTIFSGE